MSTELTEETRAKRRKKVEKGTVIAVILAFLLGAALGYMTGKDEVKPAIVIEKCSS